MAIDRIERLALSPVTGGVLLLVATVLAMAWANSPWHAGYHALWTTPAGIFVGGLSLAKPLEVWVNDALMAVFFFVVGLEIKHELTAGHLASWRRALLPALAAVGGMAVPGALYALAVGGGPGRAGWGIPTATDIAFAVGVLALLGPRVPPGLKVFLVALAVIDDLGAVAVIAIFYSADINLGLLGLGGAFLAFSWLCNRLGVRWWWLYAGLGVFGTWLAFLGSGVHATVAGVLMAFTIPCGGGDHGLGQRFRHVLEPWVALLVMPVFALANAGVHIEGDLAALLAQPVTLAVAAGLVVGKPLGIIAATALAVRSGLCRLPDGVGWTHIVAAGLLGGIGFTMALFVAGLAFGGVPALHAQAKVGILAGSLLVGAAGAALLWWRGRAA